MPSDTYQRYLALNEEPCSSDTVLLEYPSDRSATVEATGVVRSISSFGSKENDMPFAPTDEFQEDLAHGIGAGCIVQTDMTDAMMDDLDDTMNERTLPFDDLAPHEHVRQIRIWLDQLENGLPHDDSHDHNAYLYDEHDDDFTVTSATMRANAFAPIRRNRTILLFLTLVVGSTLISLASSIELSDLVVHVTFLLLLVVVALLVIV